MIHSASKLRSTSAAPPPKRPRLRGWDDESGETLQRRAEDVEWRRWRIVTSFFCKLCNFLWGCFFFCCCCFFFGGGETGWSQISLGKRFEVWSDKILCHHKKMVLFFRNKQVAMVRCFFGERMYVRNVKVGWLFEVGWTMFAWHLVPLVSVYYTCIHIKNI